MKKLYGSLENRLLEGNIIEVKIGMGVTEMYYTDREPYTIVEIPDKKHIIVRQCNARRIDYNGMSEDQNYEYSEQEKENYDTNDECWNIGISDRREKEIKKYNLGRNEKVLTLTKKGYKEIGRSNGWYIGKRMKYYDYSF